MSCLVTLIRFAVEHTGNNGEILITTSLLNNGVECKVEDQGNNYSDTLFDILTEQFSSKDVPLNLTMGIGLTVSQMIMEAHGGRLIFVKTERGNGEMKMIFPHE